MDVDKPVGSGTEADPYLRTQIHYRQCGHATLSPIPAPGLKGHNFYRIDGYVDIGGLCPTCASTRIEQEEAMRHTPSGSGSLADPFKVWLYTYTCGHSQSAPSTEYGEVVIVGTIPVPMVCFSCALTAANKRFAGESAAR